MNEFLSNLAELSKPRICLMALIMAMIGFLVASPSSINFWEMVRMLVGTGLVGVSCGMLNQYIERGVDAKMWRTMKRPLPSERMEPRYALIAGLVTGILGEIVLLFLVNPVTAVLGAFTIFFYLGIYTPMKATSPLSTIVGAIPGALPPLIGATAAAGHIEPMGFLLFSILLLWQIPHFLAIGWLYREDYARAGLPILTVVDPGGKFMAKQSILYAAVLLPLVLVPVVWGVVGTYYLWGAFMIGLAFLLASVLMARFRDVFWARFVFFLSLVYLPVIGILMVWDRTL